jgi:hypothetical protein
MTKAFLVKSEIRFRQSGRVIGLTTKEFWSIGATILAREKWEEISLVQ